MSEPNYIMHPTETRTIQGPEQPQTLPFDPSDPDAPLLALMNLQSNPELLTMDDTQVGLLLERLKSYVQQPATLTAKLGREASGKGRSSSARQEKLNKLLNL